MQSQENMKIYKESCNAGDWNSLHNWEKETGHGTFDPLKMYLADFTWFPTQVRNIRL